MRTFCFYPSFFFPSALCHNAEFGTEADEMCVQLSKARSTAKQIDALDRDMRDRNLQ